MGRNARLAIGAVALVAGVAIFCLSISLWTRDRLHTPSVLAAGCVHKREVAQPRRDPSGYLAYLAVSADQPRGAPPRITGRIAGMLVHRLGFFLVPREEQLRLVQGLRICGGRPKP